MEGTTYRHVVCETDYEEGTRDNSAGLEADAVVLNHENLQADRGPRSIMLSIPSMCCDRVSREVTFVSIRSGTHCVSRIGCCDISVYLMFFDT